MDRITQSRIVNAKQSIQKAEAIISRAKAAGINVSTEEAALARERTRLNRIEEASY